MLLFWGRWRVRFWVTFWDWSRLRRDLRLLLLPYLVRFLELREPWVRWNLELLLSDCPYACVSIFRYEWCRNYNTLWSASHCRCGLSSNCRREEEPFRALYSAWSLIYLIRGSWFAQKCVKRCPLRIVAWIKDQRLMIILVFTNWGICDWREYTTSSQLPITQIVHSFRGPWKASKCI